MIRAVWPEDDPDATEQAMRDLLGRFGLVGDQVYQPVGELSAAASAAGRRWPGWSPRASTC